MYGREKAWAEPDRRRRWGYTLLGELHVPGRLRSWHVMGELRRRGVWNMRPRSLYDAGGGEGAFACHVARRFPTWRDVDLRDPCDDQAFDIVVCADVLEHIEEDDLVVKHLAQALKPGGILIVTSPSVPQPRHLGIVAWRERRVRFDPREYGHVRAGYSADRLQKLFENGGLRPETIRFTFGPWGTLMFDLFFATGDNQPHPLVYGTLFPLYMALARLDVARPSQHGAAILGVARKVA